MKKGRGVELAVEASEGQQAEFLAACVRSGLRRCACRKCGAALEGYSRNPESQTGGPRDGWLCIECGGEVRKARD